jgi:hypothetical protein
MDTRPATPPRGRPRLVSQRNETYLWQEGWAHGFSRHDRTNTVHRLRAIKQFINDPRFAWLCSDAAPNGDPQDTRGHLRRTILTELGRIKEEDVREQLALHLCATQPKTRVAVAMIRAYRLGRRPHGTVEQLSRLLLQTLQAYLDTHPELEWEEINAALERVQLAVDNASCEE